MGNICSRRDYLNFCEARQAHRNGLINPSYVINNAPVYPYAFCNPSTYPHLRQPIHPHLYQPIHPHFHQPTHRRAQSDPGVRSLDRRPFCSQCKTSEHFTRGCPVRFAGPFGCEDDVLVESFFTEREYEPEEQRELLNTLWQ